MNILKRFTKRSLNLNKKRTIVTMIGIILSVALICSVAGVFLSLRESLIQDTIKRAGKYHSMFKDVGPENIDIIKNNKQVENFYYAEGLGYAEFNSNDKEYQPYLYVIGYNESAFKNSGLELLNGRLPKNESELLLTPAVNENLDIDYKIGDTLELDLFDLKEEFTFDEFGNTIDNKSEITNLYKKKYTIVGMAGRLNYVMDSFHEKGVSVITYSNKPTNEIKLFVYYKDPGEVYKYNEDLIKSFGISEVNIYNNEDLLRWQGVFSEPTMNGLYGIAGVVISVIIFTSVFVIKNGFAISVSERTKEYGILASIGATKKQIKKNVLYEGFVLGLISIPIGIILGIIAIYALIFVLNILIGVEAGMEFVYVIPSLAIVISITLGALTIYISALLIARKTCKISPIERVRNSDDIKIKPKKLKTPIIIKKLFKTGGVIAHKNLKRNQRKYRTTVVSMVISVVLFLTMSSFTNYMFKNTLRVYEEIDFNIYVSHSSKLNNFYELTDKIINLVGEDEYSLVKVNNAYVDNKYINYEFIKYNPVDEGGENNINIYSIGETAYIEYIKQLGGNYEEYKDKGILIDNRSIKIDSEWIKSNYYNIEDEVEFKINDKMYNLEIVKKTDILAMPFMRESGSYIVVSDELIEDMGYDTNMGYMVINSTDPNNLEKGISKISEELYVENYQEYKKSIENINLLFSIFLYGFIIVITVIGMTNIINTLTTSLNLRKKEFAMLKSIGTTSEEFRQMINLESIFIGVKVLIIGLPIGIITSYLVFYYMSEIETLESYYDPNVIGIIISVLSVFLIVKVIMSYAMKKINKQNIIETIRNDNI